MIVQQSLLPGKLSQSVTICTLLLPLKGYRILLDSENLNRFKIFGCYKLRQTQTFGQGLMLEVFCPKLSNILYTMPEVRANSIQTPKHGASVSIEKCKKLSLSKQVANGRSKFCQGITFMVCYVKTLNTIKRNRISDGKLMELTITAIFKVQNVIVCFKFCFKLQ